MSERCAEITVFTKSGGPLSKHIELINGKIANDSSSCRMAKGSARRVRIDLADIASLADLINGFSPKEAYAIGRLKHSPPDRVKVVRADKLDAAKGDPSVIARTKEHLVFGEGEPAFALLDVDHKGMPDDARRRIKETGGVWAVLCAVAPALGAAAYVERASTSAGLRNRETGETYPGSGGFHAAVPVADGADIERFLSDFHDRLWLAGYAWGIGSAAGSFLERSLVDKACGSPERLIFEGPPIIEPPLEQAPRPAVAHPGDILDTKIACPPLTDAEKEELERLKQAERARLKPQLDEARAKWSESHIERMVAAGATKAEARAQVDRWLDGQELSGDFPLAFDDPKLAGAAVAAVLAAPTKYLDETLADPFEGAAYGKGKAKLYRRQDGSLFIHSFAHGETSYDLRTTSRTGVEAEIERLARLEPLDYALAKTEAAQRLGLTVSALDAAVKAKRKASASPGLPRWRLDLMVDGDGDVIPQLSNVLVIMRGEPMLTGAFSFDEMQRSEMLNAPLPLAPNALHAGLGPYPRKVRDEDVSQVQEWLQRQIPRVGVAIVHQAVHQRARERAYHPVRDALDRLKWDGKKRIDTWLTVYLGADPTAHGSPDLDRDAGGNPVIDDSDEAVTSNGVEYLKAIGRMWLIAMVARIYRPGCKQDHMPVLEGEQGILKSTACQVLAGADYFSDHLPDIGRKDADQHLRGKWLVELAELWAMSRAQVDQFKSFLSRDTERYRPAYGRNDVQEPRTCVFVGTSNRQQYLQDETGNRRIWPIKTGEIDIERLRRDRDQLFAEAVKLFRDGVQWWPDREFEKKHIAPQQEARREPDILAKPIADYLDTLPAPDLLGPRTTTLYDLATNVLGYDDAASAKQSDGAGDPIVRFGTREQRRVTGILIGLGYKPRHTKRGNVWELRAEDRP